MTRSPTSAILSLPAHVRQAIALLVALLLLLLVCLPVWTFAAMISGMNEELADKRDLLARLQAVAALKSAFESSDRPAEQSRGGNFLAGESEATARANLQASVAQFANAQGASLLAVGNLPTLKVDAATFLGVKADLSGTIESVQKTVLALESADPPLVIRDASIWLSSASAGATPPQISAQIQVFGALSPEAVVEAIR